MFQLSGSTSHWPEPGHGLTSRFHGLASPNWGRTSRDHFSRDHFSGDSADGITSLESEEGGGAAFKPVLGPTIGVVWLDGTPGGGLTCAASTGRNEALSGDIGRPPKLERPEAGKAAKTGTRMPRAR